jgi:hypothetical protein
VLCETVLDYAFPEVEFLNGGVARRVYEDFGLEACVVEYCEFGCRRGRGAFDTPYADAGLG